jgi:hypothetical protein
MTWYDMIYDMTWHMTWHDICHDITYDMTYDITYVMTYDLKYEVTYNMKNEMTYDIKYDMKYHMTYIMIWLMIIHINDIRPIFGFNKNLFKAGLNLMENCRSDIFISYMIFLITCVAPSTWISDRLSRSFGRREANLIII